jgi:pyrimidine operon attenuation protein/uracil phosphoribosyltransferase
MTPEDAGRMLVDAAGVACAMDRIADGLAGELAAAGPVFLAGIPTRGVVLARRLADLLAARGLPARAGAVDISMHRDDLGLRGGVAPVRGTDLPLDLESWVVVLVDDVQHTGRTARAALEAVLAYGRPRRILYAVLADRGGRELPVRPDFTGMDLQVPAGSRVRVRLAGTDAGEEGVFTS